MPITNDERVKLYTKIKHTLGAPLRQIELTDEMLDTFLEIAIEDYSSFVNDWFLEQKWNDVEGLNGETSNLTFAFTTKSLDWERSFTFAYSKQVGLGNDNPSQWELKKDFVIVEADVQQYELPANREVNEVLWWTPPDIDKSFQNTYNYQDGNSVFTSSINGWTYNGRQSHYIMPIYATLAAATDVNMRERVFRSELTYKITAGANGKKILHLYPPPASKHEIAGKEGKHLTGSKVWYWYYDTNIDNRDKCLEENNDIIKLPSDLKLSNIKWDKLNDQSRTKVRKLFLAKCKQVLGAVRGKFSGEVNFDDAQRTLDYRFLLDEGKAEEEKVLEELKAQLEKLDFEKMMEKRANIAKNLNEVLQFIPMKNPIQII